jgi:hypothetical protein
LVLTLLLAGLTVAQCVGGSDILSQDDLFRFGWLWAAPIRRRGSSRYLRLITMYLLGGPRLGPLGRLDRSGLGGRGFLLLLPTPLFFFGPLLLLLLIDLPAEPTEQNEPYHGQQRQVTEKTRSFLFGKQ